MVAVWKVHGHSVGTVSCHIVNIARPDSLAILEELGDGHIAKSVGKFVRIAPFEHPDRWEWYTITWISCDGPPYQVTASVMIKKLIVSCNHAPQTAAFANAVSDQKAANAFVDAMGNDALDSSRAKWSNPGPSGKGLNLGVRSGHEFETWHIESFNKNAIAGRASYRAEPGETNGVADVLIRDTRTNQVVSEAQLKRYATAKGSSKALEHSKYDGMQKVGPADQAVEGKFENAIQYKGVSSDPMSKNDIDEITEKGGSLKKFNATTGTILTEVGKAAALGAAVGGSASALYHVTDLIKGKTTSRSAGVGVAKGSAVGFGVGAAFKSAQIGLEECVCQGAGKAVPIVGSAVCAGISVNRMMQAGKQGDVGEVCASGVELLANVGATVVFVAELSNPLGWAIMAGGVLVPWAIRACFKG
mmetsp:Transcript_81214/g.227103  ORF Transcript_81214/g.227103 Transcript_81214/m.227103 type:complete len:417 (-) Transcript_81214:312-1562(-)